MPITLTQDELHTLAWAADRGYFPEDLYDRLAAVMAESDSEYTTIEVPQRALWSLLELREEDPDAYLTCIGHPLLGKILALEGEIV